MSIFKILALAAAVIAARASATPIILSFDGLSPGPVPDGYGGINWGGNWFVLPQAQYPYSAHSGNASVYTSPGYGEVDFFFTSPVYFVGAYFAIAPSNTVYFNLYDNGQLVNTSVILKPCSDSPPGALGCQNALPGTNPPRFLPSGYYSQTITEVGVFSQAQGLYTMSDLVYNTTEAPTVPEPSTLLLTGSLLAAVFCGVLLKRRWALGLA